MTLTVVGYGTDMPSFSKSGTDTLVLMMVILLGSMLFSTLSAQMTLLFTKDDGEVSNTQRLERFEEELEMYYIKHNRLWNVR